MCFGSLNGYPKAKPLISPPVKQQAMLQVPVPDAARAYSLDHTGRHLPQHTQRLSQEAGTLSQAVSTGSTPSSTLVLQAAPRTGLDN